MLLTSDLWKTMLLLWRWDNPSSSNTSFLSLWPINNSGHEIEEFPKLPHTLRVNLSIGCLMWLPFSLSKAHILYFSMLIGSVGTWAHLCVNLCAKSVTHWPSLITCPGKFSVLWACGSRQGSTVLSKDKHVSHMRLWVQETEANWSLFMMWDLKVLQIS